MKSLVLDSDAFSQLVRYQTTKHLGRTHIFFYAALRVGSRIVVPAAVLAEQYRGGAT